MSFADFPGQHHIVERLQRSLNRGRLAHAYLMTGASLDELESMARTLAKTLNCSSPATTPATDSCDHCPSCTRIEQGVHPDILWVRPESKLRIITVEQVRNVIQTVNLKPAEAAWKVAVLVAADRLNTQAANAFLKTLEEPPPRSMLILLSAEPQRLLDTILSRCLRLNFTGNGSLAPDPANHAWLTGFAEAAALQPANLLGRYRLLGQLLARLSDLKNSIETTLAARSPLEQYDDVDPKLRETWEAELAAASEAEYRRQRAEILIGIECWLRDICLRTLDAADDLLALPQLKVHTDAVAARIDSTAAAGNVRITEDAVRLLNSNAQEALVLEVALLKLKFQPTPGPRAA